VPYFHSLINTKKQFELLKEHLSF